ncbi:MAG TPA: O-antigen ligase family protein [Xanthobacteraceae bacterium]|nr:O-antigen ligase family protein [Xanthobacteraceae bacterium]
MNLKMPAHVEVAVARALLLGVLVTVLMSTSVAIGFEILSYIAFAALAEPRRRLIGALRSRIVIALLPFAVVVFIGIFYGAASWPDAVGALAGWRRMLLLPLAAAVFDDEGSKRLACKVLLATCVVGALASVVTKLSAYSLFHTEPGIPFHNYAVQGLAFSLAAAICVAALVRPDAFAGDRVLGDRRIMAVALAMLVADVVFILSGRSTYVAMIVMLVAVVAFLVQGSWRAKALAGAGVLICVGLLLGSSANVRSRIAQAFHDMETVDQAAEATSPGYRVVFWRNTLRMVGDHPILGVGTGGFMDGYMPYVEGVPGWKGGGTGDPHNQFLKILGEQGLVGLAAFLFFIGGALACPAPSPYRQIGAAVVIGWCATSLANSHFSTFVEGRLVFFWLGAMLATQTSARTS